MVDSTAQQRSVSQVDLAVDQSEADALAACIEARWLTEGPNARKLAETLSRLSGSPHVTFAPNGTLGLFLSLLALDLPRGGEIIIPSFTFFASASTAVFAGLKPVFVDVDLETMNMTGDAVEAATTPDTVAVMPVHIYGQACDMDGIMDVARARNIAVVEDAAQGFGVLHRGRPVGAIGDIGMISFFSDKVITMGEGAALYVQDEALFEKVRLLRNQGRPNSGTFVHPEFGMNFRITDLQAALGLSQIGKFDTIHSRRLAICERYREALADVGDLRFMTIADWTTQNVPFRFPIRTGRREALEAYLEENGIQVRRCFCPMHLQPRLKQEPAQSLPASERLFEEGLCLPVHQHLSDEDVDYQISVIRKFFA